MAYKKKKENKKNGYRLGLFKENDQVKWLSNKGEKGGFALVSCRTIPEGISRDDKRDEQKLRHYAVRFEGILKINNPQLFEETVKSGIGSAKGFGFGYVIDSSCEKLKCVHFMSYRVSGTGGVISTWRWAG